MINSKLSKDFKKIKDFFSSLREIGYEKGYAKRNSKLDPLTLIETMIQTNFHNKKPSLNNYSMNFELITGESISRQAINERINNNTVEYEKEILNRSMDLISKNEIIKPKILKPFNNIHIFDSTVIDLPNSLKEYFKGFGGSSNKEKEASALKIHAIYDPILGRYNHLGMSSATVGDKKYTYDCGFLDSLENDDLCLFDLGYYSVDILRKIPEMSAYYVSRMKANTQIYQKNNSGGRKKWIEINIYKLLKKAKHKHIYDIQVYITEKKIPCRLIIFPVKKDIVNERLRKKKIEYKNRGKTISKTIIASLSYCFMITNAPIEILKTKDIYDIYRIRWSIELVFKVWKSKLNIDYVVGFRLDRVLFEFYGKLISLVLFSIFNSGFILQYPIYNCSFSEISLEKAVEYFNLVLSDIFESMSNIRSFTKQCVSYLDFIKRKCLKSHYKKRKTTLEKLETYNKGGYIVIYQF